MKLFFKRMFTAPIFEDQEKTHQAYLLHGIIWALIFLPIPYLLYTIIRMPQSTVRALVQTLLGETVNFILLLLIQRGYIRIASYIQVIAFWLFFTVAAATSDGVRSEAYFLGYPLAIIIAGILLGTRASSLLTIASIVFGGWMVYSKNSGTSPPMETHPTEFLWILSATIFPLLVLLQYLSSHTIQSALRRARVSEGKYKLISSVSSDYIYEAAINDEGVNEIIWVGGALEKITGYTFEEYMAGGGWRAHVHPDDLEKDTRNFAALSKNERVKSDIRTITKNGEIRWSRISALPIWDQQKNRISGIIGAVQDVTEVKMAEEAEKESLQHQGSMVRNIPDMAWLKDRNSRYLAVNEKFAQTAGLKIEEITGKTDYDLWDPDYAKAYQEDDALVIQDQKPRRVEEKQKDYLGNITWVETIKTPLFNSAGAVIGTTGIARDITDRKEAEALQRRRRKLLEKVIHLGQSVTEVSDLHTTITKIWRGVRDLGFDRIAIFLYNPLHASMDGTFGTNHQGEMTDEWHVSFSIKNEDNPGSRPFRHVMERPDTIYLTHNFEEEYNIPKENHIMSGVKDFASIPAWAGDKPVAFISVDQSISGSSITDEQLEALRLFAGYAGLAIENAKLNTALQNELAQRKNFIEELESKNAELERFTYTVSHDLKSPLVTINGFLGYVEKDAQTGDFEKLQSDMHRVHMAVDKMQRLLKDLLELSRIGRLINTPVEITFNEIVKDAIEILQGQIRERNVIVEYPENNLTIKGDHTRLVEVLQNLLENAIKFMGDQPEPKIEVNFLKNNENNEIVFYVKDNGMGIAPEYHDKIFGLFNKLDSDSNGTGIGLTLVKRIIEVHGGRIWVESKKGQGAVFYFTLQQP